MTEKILSVIVPVYNVEKYLSKCLDSIIDQEISNYEIIIVNDGSPDNCQTIIESYQNKYPQLIKSYIKENGGLASARNYGIERASGKYISFIDSDDYIEKNHYKKMLDLAIRENSDLVVTDFEYIWENNEHKPLYKNGIEIVNNSLNKCIFLSPLFSWNKMYRRELFNELKCRYPDGLWYEDIPVTLYYSAKVKKISYLKELGFHYLQRKSSIMGTKYSKKMNDLFTIYEKTYKSFEKDGLLDEYRDELEYSFIEQFLIYSSFRFLRTIHYKELMLKTYDFINKYFPNYKKNRYINTLNFKNRFFLRFNKESMLDFWHWFLTRGKYEN